MAVKAIFGSSLSTADVYTFAVLRTYRSAVMDVTIFDKAIA